MIQFRSFSLVVAIILVMGNISQAQFPFFKKPKPKTCLEEAAKRVDRLERELHETGTVVIKAPDIWGESRLTKHRQEFERVMEEELNGFQLLLNASIRRSDQAYLANALAIQAALPGGTLPTQGEAGQTFVNSLTTGTIAAATDGAEPLPTPSSNDIPIARTSIYTGTTATTANFTGFGDGNIGLEPTIRLDQLKRYLDHLHEIRRVNEGDDTADSPGYSLNLVRVPVSILPGEATREGHGAEITVTAKPHVSPELLAKTYRDLVINDLVDGLALAMIKVGDYIDTLAFERDGCGRVNGKFDPEWMKLDEAGKVKLVLRIGLDEKTVYSTQESTEQPVNTPNSAQQYYINKSFGTGQEAAPERIVPQYSISLKAKDTSKAIDAVSASLPQGTQIQRNARNPIAPSQSEVVFGRKRLLALGYTFWKLTMQNRLERHLPDARAFLQDQLQGGYDFLALAENSHVWSLVPEVHQAVRANDPYTLEMLRSQVFQSYMVQDQKGAWGNVEEAPSPISAAAWLVLVESALLNQRLNDDIQRVSQDPNCGCNCFGMEYQFYLPEPSEEAKQAFVDYVNCRWPIHVFALDPVVQQQNIADQYSMRREMQLALALAFAGGRIGAQSMTRYARRLEIDMETVALNKTDVAFGHGSDTFGWRFTPRVQTPPFESNTKVAFRDLLWGGPSRDHIRGTWELEAGQRECVAIVLMPSFITHMTFEARGNFFDMTDCHFELNPHDDLQAHVAQDVRWSQQMQSLHNLLNQVYCEQGHFLPGEIDRVRNRVEQLSKRLPMQTVHARVPNENTLGGFEMFSSGVTDLGPELLGFYGEPGINPQEDTTVFLVGNNFSVHDTHVLAGNRDCEFSLISRQVMKATIPAGVRTAKSPRVGTKCHDEVVDVHIATPYGVSSHLEIPVMGVEEQAVAMNTWARRQIPLLMQYNVKLTTENDIKINTYSIEQAHVFARGPHELPITPPPFSVNKTPVTVQFDFLWDYGLGQSVTQVGSQNLADIPFDSQKKQYVIAGTKYRDLIDSVRTNLTSLLNASFKTSDPPAVIDVTIKAEVGGNEIAGDLHITVRVEKLP